MPGVAAGFVYRLIHHQQLSFLFVCLFPPVLPLLTVVSAKSPQIQDKWPTQCCPVGRRYGTRVLGIPPWGMKGCVMKSIVASFYFGILVLHHFHLLVCFDRKTNTPTEPLVLLLFELNTEHPRNAIEWNR